MQKLDAVDLMEYIKIQWTDIHHTRNQDWKVLVILIGIFYALFAVNIERFWLHLAITLLGLLACGMGIYMGLIHWLIFYSKMQAITACEKELGIEANFFQPPFPIQGLVLLIYFFMASILSGWLVWLLWGKIWASFLIFTTCFLVGLITCIITKFRIRKLIEKSPPIILRRIGDKK